MTDQYKDSDSGIFALSRRGYGVNLYRDRKGKMIAGICSGVARNLDIDAGILRIVFVIGLVLTGGSLFWLYILAWLLMAKRPANPDVRYVYDETKKSYQPAKIFRYAPSAKERIQTASVRIASLTKRVEVLETYLTSKRYRLDKEFRKLEQD